MPMWTELSRFWFTDNIDKNIDVDVDRYIEKNRYSKKNL